MYLVEPHGRKRKWDIRLRIHDGRIVKIPGDRDRATALRLGERIESLVKAKVNGDPPPAALQPWIDNMLPGLARRLVELGLLSQRRIDQARDIEEHIAEYERVVASRRSNSALHATSQARKVRRVVNALRAKSLSAVTEDGVLTLLRQWDIATATRRHYVVALKDFAKWMKRTRKVVENPLADMSAPGQYEDPEVERMPLTVKEFRRLTEYLGTFVRYPHQKARWTASDRKMIYWTAVKTAFRKSELASLRRADLMLDQSPPAVAIKARHAKNKTVAVVPIPDDLTSALRKYTADLAPEDRVFTFATSCRGIVDMFRRDLAGAGIPWQLPTGEVRDFHTLRSTAITWWLDVDGLNQKKVQILARLKTLSMVDKYSRNLRIEDFGWLNVGPKLVSKTRARTKKNRKRAA